MFLFILLTMTACTDEASETDSAENTENAENAENADSIPPEDEDWPFEEGDWSFVFIAFTDYDCDGALPDQGDIDLLNAATDGAVLNYGSYPDFEFVIYSIGQDCTLNGSDFLCDFGVAGYDGSFSSTTAAAGAAFADDGMGCSYQITFEMAYLDG